MQLPEPMLYYREFVATNSNTYPFDKIYFLPQIYFHWIRDNLVAVAAFGYGGPGPYLNDVQVFVVTNYCEQDNSPDTLIIALRQFGDYYLVSLGA